MEKLKNAEMVNNANNSSEKEQSSQETTGELTFCFNSPSSHSTPQKITVRPSTQSVHQTPSSRQNVSTPIKMLHWPKFLPNKKNKIANFTKKRPPFAIMSEKWQKLHREKEEKKENLEKEKLERKRLKEEKKTQKEEDQKNKKSSKGKRRKEKEMNNQEDSNPDDPDEVADADSGKPMSAIIGEERETTELKATESPPKIEIREGDFVVGKLVYDFGTSKESWKYFLGRVALCRAGRMNDQYEVHFLRKTRVITDKRDFLFHMP